MLRIVPHAHTDTLKYKHAKPIKAKLCVNNDKAQKKLSRICPIISLFTLRHTGDLSKYRLHFIYENVFCYINISIRLTNSVFCIWS